MIESISIAGEATYATTPETLDGLSHFNFIFGGNGTGKTTISRIIADASAYPTCMVSWRANSALQAMVYNRDFVENNFNQSKEFKGVFTLGEEQTETLTKIAAAKETCDALGNTITNLGSTLNGDDGNSGKNGELARLEDELKEKCWKKKQTHDEKLSGAFEGYRGSQASFKGKILDELTSNSASVIPQADLEKKAATVFGDTPTAEVLIADFDATDLLSHETNSLLAKRVVGKDDVDIAAMIKKLENSDWVSQGRAYFAVNDSVCPFCQQDTSAEFADALNEYFDEAFATDTKAIDQLVTDYATDADQLTARLNVITTVPSKFLDVEKLNADKQLLAAKIRLNRQRLTEKKKEASRVVELESQKKIVESITLLISSANSKITAHNEMVANLENERNTLTAQIWRFVLEELKTDLSGYKKAKENLDKAIVAIGKTIDEASKEKQTKEREIRELEKQTTSVQPTIDAINSLLGSFGFQSFKLAMTEGGTSYKLVRPDGSDAKDTLSEGEKTFVTFLYFYYLLQGSNTDSGMTTDRIVVIDDPVSSLDSDVLFIVSSLIKGLFDDVREGTGHIKQLFVLTHNVYFHREITFNPNRGGTAMNEETFWVVRKVGGVSRVEKHTSNPIKTSYDLLWSEVRRPDNSNLTIQNTLRRILENYFKILGGINFEKICAMFEGRDKLICKSLFSWVNAGSHYAHDDLYLSIDDGTIRNYLRVFREIFEKSEHSAHYKMMMRDADEELAQSTSHEEVATSESASATSGTTASA